MSNLTRDPTDSWLEVTTPRIPWARPMLGSNEEERVLEALRSGWISGGPCVDLFEERMAELLDAPHAIAVSNGTTALYLALSGLGIGRGDEVIVPAYGFIAAANMVLAVGATPLYADVQADTWLIEPEEIRRLWSPRTKAVIPLHLYGNVAGMDDLCCLAEERGVPVLEDAAEATFSRYRGRSAGTLGSIGTFSFHATKTITTGEGGMVVARDPETAARMRVLRDHGMRKDRRYWHDVVGFNFRLTNYQAAMGCAQLDQLSKIVGERQRIKAAYERGLSQIPGVVMQSFREPVEPVLWTMAVRLLPREETAAELRARRDLVMASMLRAGIETRPGFYALSLLPAFDCPDLPVSSLVSAGVICLPTFVGLADEDIASITNLLVEALEEAP